MVFALNLVGIVIAKVGVAGSSLVSCPKFGVKLKEERAERLFFCLKKIVSSRKILLANLCFLHTKVHLLTGCVFIRVSLAIRALH